MTATVLHDDPVLIWTGKSMLEGRQIVPPEPAALLLVASPAATAANRGYHRIANHLAHHGFAVLYADVLSEDEAQFDSRTGHFRFDIELLASRLAGITEWIGRERVLASLPIAFLGSGAVAAAALQLAANHREKFAALLLAEARTDLVTGILGRVRTPVLLVVPDSDLAILRMNQHAFEALACEKRLEVLPDCARVIDDETNIETLAHLALRWAASHAEPVAVW